MEFITDFTLTPSLIQRSFQKVAGKLFIDIHVNRDIVSKNYIHQLDNLKIGIKEFQTSKLKFRIRYTTEKLYQLQNENAYYPFPLEAFFRKYSTYSVAKNDYQFLIDHDQIICASVHFLTSQFMRFRSLEHKTDLIGSKFIKSLNLMLKYYLLSEYLKGKEFKFGFSETEVREYLTPQFSNIKMSDPVTSEQWKIIEAQLLYLLKDIRDELCQYDTSLAVLRF